MFIMIKSTCSTERIKFSKIDLFSTTPKDLNTIRHHFDIDSFWKGNTLIDFFYYSLEWFFIVSVDNNLNVKSTKLQNI